MGFFIAKNMVWCLTSKLTIKKGRKMTTSRKETIFKYREEIDALSNDVRKWISSHDDNLSKEEILTYVENAFFECKKLQSIKTNEIKTIIDSVFMRTSSKYGILSELLEDSSINEIMVNGPNYIYVEKNRKVIPVDDAFTSAEELEEVIRMFASDI